MNFYKNSIIDILQDPQYAFEECLWQKTQKLKVTRGGRQILLLILSDLKRVN